MRPAARASLIVTTALLAGAPAALGQLSADIGIVVTNAVWNGGTAWTGPDEAIITFQRPSWAGQASDQLTRDGRLAGSSGWFTPSGDWTRVWRNLAEGTYVVRASVRTRESCYTYYGSRYCSYATGSQSTMFSVDASAPSPPFPGGGEGPAASGDAITWTPSHDGGSGVARYEVLVDGALRAEVGAGQCASQCTAAVDPSHMPDGARQVTVRAIDGVGNASEASVLREVRDTPQVTVLDPPAFVLKGRQAVLRAAASVPNGGSLGFDWDLDGDGRFETSTGTAPSVRVMPDDDVTIAVRATAPGGGTATAEHDLDVRVVPPSDDPGVTIEQGERYANDRRVALELSWPEGATTMRIGTDGGFRGVRAQPVQPEATITLQQHEDARLPHVVYVRFQGPGIDARETYTDDIILDTTAPVVDQATADRVRSTTRITSRARDGLSGVESLEVAAGLRRPVVRVPYTRRATVRVAAARPLVRVVDRAGNASRWVRARRG
jgi:hypothetical protein